MTELAPRLSHPLPSAVEVVKHVPELHDAHTLLGCAALARDLFFACVAFLPHLCRELVCVRENRALREELDELEALIRDLIRIEQGE